MKVNITHKAEHYDINVPMGSRNRRAELGRGTCADFPGVSLVNRSLAICPVGRSKSSAGCLNREVIGSIPNVTPWEWTYKCLATGGTTVPLVARSAQALVAVRRVDKGAFPWGLYPRYPCGTQSRRAVHWGVDLRGSRGEVCCEVRRAFQHNDPDASRKYFPPAPDRWHIGGQTPLSTASVATQRLLLSVRWGVKDSFTFEIHPTLV